MLHDPDSYREVVTHVDMCSCNRAAAEQAQNHAVGILLKFDDILRFLWLEIKNIGSIVVMFDHF